MADVYLRSATGADITLSDPLEPGAMAYELTAEAGAFTCIGNEISFVYALAIQVTGGGGGASTRIDISHARRQDDWERLVAAREREDEEIMAVVSAFITIAA